MSDVLWVAVAALLILGGLRLIYPPHRTPAPVDRRPTCLYRFYDDHGRLVYVGITNHLGRRIGQHDTRKPWWQSVTRVTVEHFPDRPEAEAAEKTAIRRERPRHNIAHAGTRKHR